MKENSICGDNRFEIIEKAKEMLLNATNIEDSKEEMKVLTNILFRMWQVGLINEEKLDINKLQKENSIEEDIKILEEFKTNGYSILLMKYGDRIKTNFKLAKAIERILLDYKRLRKENEEKNKIIDSMIKVMIDSSICDYFIKENCKNYAGENRKICDDCIKEYFENKVKEVK